MALPPSLSTAALYTCALSTPPLFSSPLIRGWDSTVDSSRLFAIPDFHPSTFDITSGFQFLNFILYLVGVWSSSMIRDAVATVISYWFQVGALCALRCGRHLLASTDKELYCVWFWWARYHFGILLNVLLFLYFIQFFFQNTDRLCFRLVLPSAQFIQLVRHRTSFLVYSASWAVSHSDRYSKHWHINKACFLISDNCLSQYRVTHYQNKFMQAEQNKSTNTDGPRPACWNSLIFITDS